MAIITRAEKASNNPQSSNPRLHIQLLSWSKERSCLNGSNNVSNNTIRMNSEFNSFIRQINNIGDKVQASMHLLRPQRKQIQTYYSASVSVWMSSPQKEE